MPKKNVFVYIEGVKQEQTSPKLRIRYGKCTRGYDGSLIASVPNTISVYDSTLDIHDLNAPKMNTFIKEFIGKQAPLSYPNRKLYGVSRFQINSRAHGLRLVLDALTLRFSIALVQLTGNFADQEFEAMRECFRHYYRPLWGPAVIRCYVTNYNPWFHEVASALGSDKLSIYCHDINTMTLEDINTSTMSICVQCNIWEPTAVSNLIVDWEENSNRRIANLKLESRCFHGGPEWVAQLQKRHKVQGKIPLTVVPTQSSISYYVEHTRTDGKTLRATLCLHKNCGMYMQLQERVT